MSAAAAATEKTESLEDLLVEGEMYHQYQLSAKLAETVEKIDRLFPGADEKNQRVRDLYDAAGYTPKFKAPAAAAAARLPGQMPLPQASRHSNLLTTCGKFPKSPPTFIVNQLRKECSRSPSMRLAGR